MKNKTISNKTTQTKSKKQLGLNIAIGCLAGLGCVGTIVFGSLWCSIRSRNSSTPSVETTGVPLPLTYDSDNDVFMASIPVDQQKEGKKFEIIMDTNDISSAYKDGKSLASVGLKVGTGEVGSVDPVEIDWQTKLTCSTDNVDEVVPPSHYDFSPFAEGESSNLLYEIDEPDVPKPEHFDADKSIWKIEITLNHTESKPILVMGYIYFIGMEFP